MQEVGCPEPAAVVAIMERMLSLRAFSLTASIVEAEGPIEGLALMGFTPCPARIRGDSILHRQNSLTCPISTIKAMATNTNTKESEMIRTAAVISRLAWLAASFSLSGDSTGTF